MNWTALLLENWAGRLTRKNYILAMELLKKGLLLRA